MVPWDWISLFNFEGTTCVGTALCRPRNRPRKLKRRLVGGLAQLGERLPCKQEVSGSIPLISTRIEKSGAPIEASESRFNGERKQSGVTELWTERESDTAGANGTKLLLTMGQ